jgi:hypothetical protein
MLVETWASIPRYKGLYEASTYGRIRGVKRGIILRCELDRGGYPRVHPSVHGKQKHALVHVLVAETFLGPRPKGKQINHKNGITNDSRPENLEYLTCRENHLHAYRVLGRKKNQGSRHGMSKLTDSDVLKIRSTPPMPLADIAQRFGVSISTVSMIRARKIWRHI